MRIRIRDIMPVIVISIVSVGLLIATSSIYIEDVNMKNKLEDINKNFEIKFDSIKEYECYDFCGEHYYFSSGNFGFSQCICKYNDVIIKNYKGE